MKKQLLSTLIVLLGLSTSAYAQQPGSLDATFNGKGIKNFAFVSSLRTENVTASYLQPDGKLLVASTSSAGVAGDTLSYITRLMPDGKEDLTFGVGGKKELDAKFLFGNTAYFVVYAIALQNDGTIVLGGTRRGADYDYACIVSLNKDGSFNESFANGLSCVVLGEAGNMIRTIQIHQKTGNIWACGGSPTYANSGFFISGVTRTGQTFMGDGGVLSGNYFPEGTGFEYATTSLIKGDVLYLGGTVRAFDAKKHLGVMAIDVTKAAKSKSFFNDGAGTTGTVSIAFPPEASASENECTVLNFTPDSSALFLGGYTIGADASFILFKINLKNGGYIDNTFSGDGANVYHINGSSNNYLRAMVTDPSGRMLLLGTLNSEVDYWTTLRLLPNGNIDKTFGAAGSKVYDGSKGNSMIQSFYPVGLHYNRSSQKYLMTGYYNNPATSSTAGLVKQITYTGDADNGYATTSQKIIANGKEESALIRNVAVRSDGKILIGGPSENAETGQQYLAMLNEDGSQDRTFSTINLTTFVSNFLLSQGITATTVKITDLKVQSDNANKNKILVAGHFVDASLDGYNDLFILRLNPDGSLDNQFNGNGCYKTLHPTGLDYKTQGITLRSDGGIVWYGYFYNYFQDESNYYHALMQFNANGVRNDGFNTGNGIYIHTAPVSSIDDFSKSMDVAVRSDNKIIVASSAINGDDNSDFLVFRVGTSGTLDTDFGISGDGIVMIDYGSAANQYAASVALTSDNRIVIGGQTRDVSTCDNLLVLLTEKGEKDTTFGNGGYAPLNRTSGTNTESIGYVAVKDNKILATGIKLVFDPVLDGDRAYFSLMRFTLTGILDNTFINRGYTFFEGYGISSVVANNKLYFAGSDRKLDGTSEFKGWIGRAVLGTGPVIKVTNLQATNYNKFLGDAPFLLSPVSNSPGDKLYSVTSSGAGCVTVDPSSGLVNMTCATVNSGSVVVRVIQPAINGFTADTAYSTINVGKGIPKINFNPQGDTLTSNFVLIASSDSDKETTPSFYVVDGNEYVLLNGDGTAYINAVGCATVQVYYNETNNYLSAYANTSICGYPGILPPIAYNDNITLTTFPAEQTSFNPLANDEARTGTIASKGIDLDPSTPGIQRTFDSPALGSFTVDTINNVVVFNPFEGFVGKASVNYAVYDSKQSRSNIAQFVISLPQAKVPDLKATELFTPNNDGLNDAFVIGYTILNRKNKLTVFDRNGAELFSQTDYNNDWKGELTNGKQAENGIYYFTFTEGGDGDELRELKGSVELKR